MRYTDADRKKLLRLRQVKATPRRVLLLKLLQEKHEPLAAEVIYSFLRDRLDRVTVYRTLETFEMAGIVVKVNVRGSREYYELAPAAGAEHHHHLVCSDCGEVEDVDVPEPKNFEKSILRQSKQFKEITSHSLEFFGTCRSCALTR